MPTISTTSVTTTAASPRRSTPSRTTGLLAASSLVALLVGCASPQEMSPREKGTAQGAAIGAVAGAVLGKATGGKTGESAAIGGVIGAVAGNLWSKRMEEKRAALERASSGTGTQVARTADNRLRVAIPSDFSFDVGRADIKANMRPVLDEVARNLDQQIVLTVIGHTDDTGPDEVNDRLSLDRAQAVRSYLAQRGVPSSRITVDGRGEREPTATNTTDAGRALNRRVEIFLADQAG